MRRARLVWLMVFAWAALIFTVSSIPARKLPSLAILHHDKVLHAVLYAPLGALLLLAVRASARVVGIVLIVAAAVLAGLYGVTDEVHQLFVRGRSSDPYDVMADLVGGAIGAIAAYCIASRRSSASTS